MLCSAFATHAAAENIFEIDITPEEAQRYLQSPPFTQPQLSTRQRTLPLIRYDDARFRSADAGPTLGHYWKNGREIENTEDYVEHIYDAQQYHGQDGLGAYAYGYQAPESAKVESREHSGVVRGSYTYDAGLREPVRVQYYADHSGFHQEDNLPKPPPPQPPQETVEVREARMKHEQAWQQAARQASLQPDPQSEYSAQYDTHNEYRDAGAFGGDYEPAASSSVTQERQQEATGPPRGFFYSFTYPVSIIEPKHPQPPIDRDTVGVNGRR